ncbi:hypothetical protein [Sphingomonas bacterium]|uniref:hypothetical protein n=1 Tax=Sphingomonas bacterium TaxID=1895847 RepID=UPI001576D77B|nr:hypothetical protein [Sphingomonas bacterium]
MPVFRKAADRLADLLRNDRRVTYRVSINARFARYVTPLMDRLAADDEDGETLRSALVSWRYSQRPPIAVYQGDVSTCRIDGPWQMTKRRWFPLGGLILSPGVTAHLNPFEAQALHKRMQEAIEDTTLAWVRDHDLRSHRRGPEEIDRIVADPAAKVMIAAWAFGQRGANAMPNTSSGEGSDCCSGETGDALCEACRKGPDHD